jgi:hypothetical protein
MASPFYQWFAKAGQQQPQGHRSARDSAQVCSRGDGPELSPTDVTSIDCLHPPAQSPGIKAQLVPCRFANKTFSLPPLFGSRPLSHLPARIAPLVLQAGAELYLIPPWRGRTNTTRPVGSLVVRLWTQNRRPKTEEHNGCESRFRVSQWLSAARMMGGHLSIIEHWQPGVSSVLSKVDSGSG